MKQTFFVLVLVFLGACGSTSKEDTPRLFRQFTKRFKQVDLPIQESLLYRVHGNDLVSARIDTLMVQQFIDKNYKLRLDMPTYDGYGYGIRLPKKKELNYEGLIYYQSKGKEQFFILSTYNFEGKLIASMPISGDSSSYKRLTGRITDERTIIVKDFILNHPEKGTTEYVYEINDNGQIEPQDTFYQK